MRSLIPGLALLCLSCASAAPMSGAAPALSGEVRTTAQLVRKAAPHGQAHITELAAGTQAWVGILEIAPGVAVPEHRDPTEETIHVLSGSGRVTIDGVASDVGTGDTIFMPANARVSYTNGPEPLRAVQVFAGPAPASKYATWKPAAE